MATLDSETSEKLFSIIPLMHTTLIKPFESLLRDEITPLQFYTLFTLARCGSMTMSELAGILGIPKQQMTKIVNYLVSAGIVQRSTDESDRRLIKICIRPDAISTILGYREKTCRCFAEALSVLSEEEKQILCKAADSIHSILPKISFQNH